MPASWDKMPSYEGFRADQLFNAPQPSAGMGNQIPANLGFGAGEFTSDDFAGFNTGPNPNDLAFNYSLWGGSNNTVNPYGADVSGQNYYMPGLDFNYSMPGFGYSDFFNTPGAGQGYGGGLLGGSTKIDAPTILDPYTVTGTDLSNLGLLNFDPNARYLGPRNPFELDPTDGGAGIVVNTSSTTGPVTMTPFTVSDTVVTTPSVELTATPELEPGGVNMFTPSTTGTGPVTMTPFVVSDTVVTTPSVELTVTPEPSGGNVFTPATTGTGPVTMTPFVVSETRDVTTSGPVTMTPFTVSEDRITTPPITTSPVTTGTGPVTMTPFTVSEVRFTSPDIPVFFTSPIVITTQTTPFTTPVITTPSVTTARPTTAMPTTTPIVSTGGGGGGGGTTPSTSGTAASSRRNLKAELEESMRALRANQGDITGMYKDLYNAFMPEGLNAAEASSLAQMRADEEKLARLRAGILSPEDVRTGQQAAREAYAARGQIMGPGAIGAEIYNRENIRQAREDAARAAYQQSMGNVLRTADLKTGNIFQPVGSLISNTFNPLGTYPADVYGTNVNADLAREIAQKNYEAAVRSAELSGSAARSAANTSAAGQLASSAATAYLGYLAFACWIAREVYGPENPKWRKFRTWLFTKSPAWFFRWYMENGESFAKWLSRNPWMKPAIRFWMDSRIRSMEKQVALKEAF